MRYPKDFTKYFQCSSVFLTDQGFSQCVALCGFESVLDYFMSFAYACDI